MKRKLEMQCSYCSKPLLGGRKPQRVKVIPLLVQGNDSPDPHFTTEIQEDTKSTVVCSDRCAVGWLALRVPVNKECKKNDGSIHVAYNA
jgi:hypothetical protein